MASLKYWLWLTSRSGMEVRDALRVLDHFGTPERAYFADPEEYAGVEGLSPARIRALKDRSLERPEEILGECERLGLDILTIQDAQYPERLRQIADPPVVLYLRGHMFHFDEEVAIGVVGARQPSLYGENCAGRLGL